MRRESFLPFMRFTKTAINGRKQSGGDTPFMRGSSLRLYWLKWNQGGEEGEGRVVEEHFCLCLDFQLIVLIIIPFRESFPPKKKYRVSALWIFFSHVMATMGPTSGPLDGRIMDYAGKGIGIRAYDSNIFILNTFETSYFVVSP